MDKEIVYSPEDETLRLKVVKSNLCAFSKSFGLVISDEGVEWCDAPATSQEQQSQLSRRRKQDEAAQWLKSHLRGGPKPAQAVKLIFDSLRGSDGLKPA